MEFENGAYRYLQQLGKNYTWSEVLFAPGVVSGALTIANANWAQGGAVAFVIHSIQLQTPAVPVVVVQFTDPLGKIMLRFGQAAEATGQYVFPPHIYEGKVLRIVCSSNVVNFTVCYQYLRFNDKTKK